MAHVRPGLGSDGVPWRRRFHEVHVITHNQLPVSICGCMHAGREAGR